MDIAVGTGYAVICLMLVSAMNPIGSEEAGSQLSSQSRLDSAIGGYVRSVGMVALAYSPQEDLCHAAAEMSNSTLVLDPIVDGNGCLSAPQSPVATSSLSLSLPGRTVVVEAWLARE